MTSPFWISMSVGLAATLLTLPPGIATAWILERTRWPGRAVLHGIVLVPLALPPVVTGYLLLRLFSPRGGLGQALAALGMPVAFHWLGAVVTAAVVGFPLFVIIVGVALKAVDPRYETTSRSLGRGGWQTFWRVTLPLSWPGILAGAVLCFARGLGEFGATIVLAGRIPAETETIPMSIYALMDQPGMEGRITTLVAVSLAIAFTCVVVSRALDRVHLRRLEVER